MATLEKKYVYKVSRDGTYLGVLPNVTSEFEYSHNINSAGCQLMVTVSDSADTSNLPVEALLDEYGNELLAEDGSVLTTERVADLVGDGNSNSLIRNDNDVEVVEYSEYYPNGSTVFRGYMSKLKVYFGGSDSVDITILSNGQDLNHYLVSGGTSATADQIQVTQDEALASPTRQYMMQTFTVGAGVTNISKIDFWCSTYIFGTAELSTTIYIYGSYADALAATNALASATLTVNTQDNYGALYSVTFSTPATVTAGQVCAVGFRYWYGGNDYIFFYGSSAAPYAGGQQYTYTPGVSSLDTGDDLYFKTYTTVPSTAHTYTAQDPSTIFNTELAYYASSGGVLDYATALMTGYSVTYTFNINTQLEGINKVLELGPADWYWYTNPATDAIYYKQSGTTADHTMIKGRHIYELSIEMTKEEIANVVYFTGGEVTAGVNAYVNVNDTTSLVDNRRGLVRLNDPKVKGATGNATGTIIANNYIDGHNEQTYITQIEIVDGTYDITLFNIGEIVGFGSFGTFVDQLLLQIVGIKRKVDSVVLSLGVLPHRATEQMEEVQRSLEASQTVNNPSAPS